MKISENQKNYIPGLLKNAMFSREDMVFFGGLRQSAE